MRSLKIIVSTFLLTASAASIAAAEPAQSVEKVVVTGSRIGAIPEDKLGSSVSIVTDEQISERQTVYTADILRDVPGVSVNRSGGVGGTTQVRMRGAEGNHTMVLLDGAEINDPFQGEFDIAGLLASDISRIEILRGSQSALYGSDAIGGVINIIPRRGEGELSFAANAEAGAFNTYLGAVSASFGTNDFDFYASTSYHTSAGTNISRFGSEDDGTNERSFFVNTGLQLSSNIEVRALLRQTLTQTDGDPQDFDFFSPTQGLVIDGDDVTRTNSLYGSVSAETTSASGIFDTKLAYNFVDATRYNYAFGAPSFFSEGHRDKISFVVKSAFNTGGFNHGLTAAVDWKNETYQNLPIGVPTPVNDKRNLQNLGGVATYDTEWQNLNAGIAIRHDKNERFQDATTYRLQASYKLGDTRLRATAGTGIKNPNNFELFGFDPASFIGNPNLKPEKSTGWDVGVDHYLLDRRIKLTATYFQAELEDEIFTDFIPPTFVATTKNRATTSERRGIEATLDASLETLTINAAYTYLDAEENGQAEVRRPRHSGSVNVSYELAPDSQVGFSIRYNGEQQDNEFIFATPADFVTLGSFTLINLYASHRLTENIEAYARVENLLDEQYEEVFSFASPGVSAYAGLRLKL